MKTYLPVAIAILIFNASILPQPVNAQKPLTAKSVAPAPTVKTLEHPGVEKKPTKPPTPPTDMQTAAISLVVGDDGKDGDTKLVIEVVDNNNRVAARYSSKSDDEYYTGSTITLPMQLQTNVPTGEIIQKGSLPLPVMRQANVFDFENGNGGWINIVVATNGHDTWKIKTFSVILSFENDKNSPHRLTWSGIVLSQDARTRRLLFDKNLDPIQ